MMRHLYSIIGGGRLRWEGPWDGRRDSCRDASGILNDSFEIQKNDGNLFFFSGFLAFWLFQPSFFLSDIQSCLSENRL